MVNNYTGVGRIAQNAELKYTTKGIAKCVFSICINKSWKQEGEWKNKAMFFNCIVWGKYGEAMHRHLTKGRQIGIIGELEQNLWTDNEGAKHNDIHILVNSISLMAQPKNGGDNSGHEPPPEEGQTGGSDEPPDIVPF